MLELNVIDTAEYYVTSEDISEELIGKAIGVRIISYKSGGFSEAPDWKMVGE